MGRRRVILLLTAMAVTLLLAGRTALAITYTTSTRANFKLNKANGVGTALTELVSNAAGPVLTLDTDSMDWRATPLRLETQTSSQAPLTVNPEAGTATNLSADELDGQDSSAFARECQDEGGAVRGFAHVRAAAGFPSTMAPLEWYDADSCGGQGVLAKRKAEGEYYVQFPGANTYYASVGSTEVAAPS